MKKAVIYGAGNIGKSAYACYKNDYEVLFFCDKDPNKQGTRIEGLVVCSPEVLFQYPDVRVIVASIYYKEILQDIKKLGLPNRDIVLFKMDLQVVLPSEIEKELDERTIDLGAFLYQQKEPLVCKELTFCPGGSGVLDYLFLRQIARIFTCKEYCEIGTYIGESINILSDCCEKLYSVTAPMDAPYAMKKWCIEAKIPDYSERLTYSEKINHYFTDSKLFDFSKIAGGIDLYFIDGDHSYRGVYYDTLNIFKAKKKDAIVVWHDFKTSRNQYNVDVVRAVSDVLGSDFKNVYVTNNNLCGIYLPDSRLEEFTFTTRERKYEEAAPLYTYDVTLNNCQIKL